MCTKKSPCTVAVSHSHSYCSTNFHCNSYFGLPGRIKKGLSQSRRHHPALMVFRGRAFTLLGGLGVSLLSTLGTLPPLT